MHAVQRFLQFGLFSFVSPRHRRRNVMRCWLNAAQTYDFMFPGDQLVATLYQRIAKLSVMKADRLGIADCSSRLGTGCDSERRAFPLHP